MPAPPPRVCMVLLELVEVAVEAAAREVLLRVEVLNSCAGIGKNGIERRTKVTNVVRRVDSLKNLRSRNNIPNKKLNRIENE